MPAPTIAQMESALLTLCATPMHWGPLMGELERTLQFSTGPIANFVAASTALQNLEARKAVRQISRGCFVATVEGK